jgi:WD40 repeat protein
VAKDVGAAFSGEPKPGEAQMSAGVAQGPGISQVRVADAGQTRVDARESVLQIGDENTQINYITIQSDRVDAPPIKSFSGKVKSPYRGLAAFRVSDEPFFFGRDDAADEVLRSMARCADGSGMLVVSGVSGAGKSSLLQAGVLPRMRLAGLPGLPGAAHWPPILLTPGSEPLAKLSEWVAARLSGITAATLRRELENDPEGFALTSRQAALAQPLPADVGAGPQPQPDKQRLLLIVDQFEQVFTQCQVERQRQAFFTALQAAAGGGGDREPGALVVIGVRADFEARCADYPQLRSAIQDRYLLTSMTELQLRLAIAEPARITGGSVAPELVDALLAQVRTRQPAAPGGEAGSGAGVLPLLSHALDQAWRGRAAPDVLTLSDYGRTGGIEGAVAASAQHAYAGLTAPQQGACQQLFIRLTATTSEGVDTAQRVRRADLIRGKSADAVADVEAVIEAFVAERLLTVGDDTVEISHEVLLSAWPLLRDYWLAQTQDDRFVRTRLRAAATEWEKKSRDASYLYSGSLLEAAAATAARAKDDSARYPALSPTEQEFLGASERARVRRLRLGQAIIAVVVLCGVGLAAFAVVAVRARQQADTDLAAAVSGKLVAQSEVTGDTNPVLARLESMAAWRIDPTQQARYAMLAAARLPGIAVLNGSGASVNGVAFSPDGKVLAAGSGDGQVRLWDVTTEREIGRPLGQYTHADAIYCIAFTPDGAMLAAAGKDNVVRLWDIATGKEVAQPLGSPGGRGIASLAISPDGDLLATGGYDGTVQFWDTATGQQAGSPISIGNAEVLGVKFSPDGTTLATASTTYAANGDQSGSVRLWSVQTRRQLGAPLASYVSSADSLAFSPDGRSLATGWGDGLVDIYSLPSRRIHTLLIGAGGTIDSLAYSPDGATVAGGSYDGAAQLWDVANGDQIGSSLASDTRPVESVAFSPDGATLATGSTDGQTRLWSVAADFGNPARSVSIGHAAESVAFSPDGKVLAVGAADGTARLLSPATLAPLGAPIDTGTGRVSGATFSPDGAILATANADGTARMWDVATHQQLGSAIAADAGAVNSVAFSPDGNVLATGNADGSVLLWDVATHARLGVIWTTGEVFSVAFSPDGTTLATGSYGGTVQLWDVATRRQVGALSDGQTWTVFSVTFSPDGGLIATGSSDFTARLWNAGTKQGVGAPLSGDTDTVSSVAFSPDGRFLATASYDGQVRLWDVATLQQIGGPISDGISGAIESVAFSPNEQTLATAGYLGTVQLWDVSYLTHPVAYLCAAARTTLTRAQWARYARGPAYQDVCP